MTISIGSFRAGLHSSPRPYPGAMGKVLVAVLVAVVSLPACGGEHAEKGREPAAAADWSWLDPGWSQLEPPPFVRARAASVWTDRELFFWGGDTGYGGSQHADSASYDPASRKWGRVPPAPIEGRSRPAAVWTGEEVLLWGGWRSDGAVGDGAAYDPASRSWRVLPDAPLGSRHPAAAVWTGEELLVWGNASRSAERIDGAAYDPAADEWRRLSPAPFALNQASAVWTGQEMIVFGALLDGNNRAESEHARGLAYDPEADSWRTIAPSRLSPQAATVVWTADGMLAWDYDLRAGLYEPVSDTWSDVPPLPLRFYECYPQGAAAGRFVLAYHCGSAALFDVDARVWHVVPGRTRIYGSPVAADGAVLFPGAAHEGHANALWAYKPGADGPTGFVARTQRQGDRRLMPLTFPNDTSIVVSYPEWLELETLGVQPDVSYLHREDPPSRFPLGFYFGEVPRGAGPVVARAGRWTITAPGRTTALDTLRRSVVARETPDGLVALEALPPLGLARESGEGGGPELSLGDLNPDPEHTSLDPLVLLRPHDCGLRDPEIGRGHGAKCLGDLYVGVYGDRAFIESVLDGLRLEQQP